MRLDVEVFKEDGAFVARAPLSVPADVTLGKLKVGTCDSRHPRLDHATPSTSSTAR
jgi:hypothetical protein